jgi:hypothetical protein
MAGHQRINRSHFVKEHAMELLDRYLQAVKKHLPWKRQDDILAELRANMESQLEDRQAELGRPLTQGELEDWLRALGSPVLVASRYQPQEYLIGPALYPMYLYVLRLALLWAMVIYTAVSTVVLPFTSPGETSLIEALLRAPGVLFTVATWVTLVFAAFEFVTSRHPGLCPPLAAVSQAWSPSSLPPLDKEAVKGGKPRSYATAVAEVVFGFLVLAWILLIPRHPFLLMGPGVVVLDGPFRLADIWWTFFWWIVALNVLQLAWKCINLMRGTWQRPSKVQHIVFKVFGLIPLGLVLSARNRGYVLLRNPAIEHVHYANALESINKSIYLGLLVICAIAALQLAFDTGQMLLRAWRARGASR